MHDRGAWPSEGQKGCLVQGGLAMITNSRSLDTITQVKKVMRGTVGKQLRYKDLTDNTP